MFGLFSRHSSFEESGLLKGAVDNHSHILYGLDDGVKTFEESSDILNHMISRGVDHVWFTPHVMEDVPNTTEQIRDRFRELKERLGETPLKFSLAAEYMMDNLFARRLEDRDLLLHGGDRVLVETSTLMPPIDFWETLEKMMKAGYRPLLAHPERYRYMSKKDYDRLAKMGVLLQMNIPSILGFYGEEARVKARNLLNKDMYCMLGSDCHRFRSIKAQYSTKKLSKKELRHLETIMKGLPEDPE